MWTKPTAAMRIAGPVGHCIVEMHASRADRWDTGTRPCRGLGGQSPALKTDGKVIRSMEVQAVQGRGGKTPFSLYFCFRLYDPRLRIGPHSV